MKGKKEIFFLIFSIIMIYGGFQKWTFAYTKIVEKWYNNVYAYPQISCTDDYKELYENKKTDLSYSYNELVDSNAIYSSEKGGFILELGIDYPLSVDYPLSASYFEFKNGQLYKDEIAITDNTGDIHFFLNAYEALINGVTHCVPTSAAMVIGYHYLLEKNGIPYIKELAKYLDTADQNPDMNNGDNVLHVDTKWKDIISGLEEYANKHSYSIIRYWYKVEYITDDDYWKGYKTLIDNNIPVILSIDYGRHAVAGFGYKEETREALVYDPFNETTAVERRYNLFSKDQKGRNFSPAFYFGWKNKLQLAPPIPDKYMAPPLSTSWNKDNYAGRISSTVFKGTGNEWEYHYFLHNMGSVPIIYWRVPGVFAFNTPILPGETHEIIKTFPLPPRQVEAIVEYNSTFYPSVYAPVPEPCSIFLMGIGLVGLLTTWRRGKS